LYRLDEILDLVSCPPEPKNNSSRSRLWAWIILPAARMGSFYLLRNIRMTLMWQKLFTPLDSNNYERTLKEKRLYLVSCLPIAEIRGVSVMY
jgi:hypothetical protein